METSKNTSAIDIPKVQFKRSVSKQIALGLFTNFSNIAPSMSLGFSAVALPALTNPNSNLALNVVQLSWFASIASLSTPLGCFFSGPISDRFGRKSAMYTVHIVCLLGWLIVASAYHLEHNQYKILLMGRLLTGLSTGLSSMPATIYMAEISSMKLRGIFCTWSCTSFAVGILIVYTLGAIFKDNWGTIAFISAILPVIGMIFTIFFVPESPAWLIGKNRTVEAKRNLCKIFGTKEYNDEVNAEIEHLIQIKGIKNSEKKQKTVPQQMLKKIKHLLKPNCLRPFFLILVFFFFQQLSGTYAIVFYAINIVEKAKIQLDPYITIIIIGIIRFFAATLLTFFCRIAGRRPLSIISGIGMTLTMILLGTYIHLLNYNHIKSINFLPMFLLLVYFFISTIGFLALPFAMAAEVFPSKVRGTASGLITALAYFFNFIAVKIYPTMMELIGPEGVFFFYGIMALAGTIFVILLLPETKGKTLSEIQQLFRKY